MIVCFVLSDGKNYSHLQHFGHQAVRPMDTGQRSLYVGHPIYGAFPSFHNHLSSQRNHKPHADTHGHAATQDSITEGLKTNPIIWEFQA